MMKSLKILFLTILLLSNGCLEDKVVSLENIELEPTAKILRFIESTGDFANSLQSPGTINVDEVYTSIDQYIILDIRTTAEFVSGHIQTAINIQTDKLYEIVDSLNIAKPSKKILLVSKNGQASSYFVSLLRMAGFKNTFGLKFGMAYWNIQFADEWINIPKRDEGLSAYVNIEYPKLQLTTLPKIDIPVTLKSNNEIGIYRIKEVIKNGFQAGINYSVNFNEDVKDKHFKICYGQRSLYESVPFVGGVGHPPETRWYQDGPLFDFRSVNYLQTLPSDQPIIIYSGSGHSSACIAAYLTVLGYNVKTLLFGANQLFYSSMGSALELLGEKFKPDEIRNYPYVTGN